MVRQRQDLSSTTAFERDMADRQAEEVYQNLRLGFIREDKDPNDSEADDVYEGYETPVFDVKKGHAIATEEAARCKEHRLQRLRALESLRKDKAHKKLDAFDRIAAETQQWVSGNSGCSESQTMASSSRRATHSQLDDQDDLSQLEAPVVDMLTTTPSYLKGKLRNYQVEGVNWLLNLFDTNVNGILADEMGLGKTFQTIATVSYLKFSHGLPGPHLVVVPKSVLGNWYREFRKWCPALNVYRFHSSSDIRKQLVQGHLKHPIKHDVILTTFEMVLYEFGAFSKIQWQYLIVDEAHKLKNDEGQVHNALAKLKTWHRLLITGTPLQNDLKELRALLHFLSPELFDDAEAFAQWFDASSGDQDENAISRMHVLLKPMMLRRLKKDVNTDIPPKKEIYVTCKMSKKQKDWYLSVMAKNAEAINRGGGGGSGQLDNILMHLRKVVNHPYLMPGAEDGPPFKTDEKLITDAGKMIVLDKLLKKLKNDEEGKHKVLIFSQMTRMVDVLEDYCILRGWQYCRLDGSTTSYDRDKQMAQFNNPNSEKFVFLLSTRAGGLGINLQAANNVVLYDSDWNPQMDLQAQDRAHRIGQTRQVRIFRFITDGTVEERIYKRALKKLYLDAMVVQQGRMVGQDKKASKEEMLSMVKFGAEAIFKSKNEDITDADIDRLLEQGEKANDAIHNAAKGDQQASLANFKLGVEESNIYDFDGVNYKSGVQSKMLHITLNEAISQDALHDKCAVFGDIVRTTIHPNLKEALVSFRTQGGASEALQHLEFKCAYAAKDAQIVVTTEMIGDCWNDGTEELGRGKRKTREPVDKYSEEQLERMQKQTKLPPLKLPKKPSYRPYQLYNESRLVEIYNTEVSILASNWKRKYTPTAAQQAADTEAAAKAKEEGVPPPAIVEDTLSPDEIAEREQLIEEGFPNWSHDEYRRFLQILSSGLVDKTDYAKIAQQMETKSEGEVRDYAHAFWERGPKILRSFESIQNRIERGMKRIYQEQAIVKAAQWKVESYTRPQDEMKFNAKPGKGYELEMDRRMFLHSYDNGMKVQDLGIEEKVKSMPEYRYDIFYQTRDKNFFESRLRTLITTVKNEHERPLIESGQLPPRQRKRKEKPAAAEGEETNTTAGVSPVTDGASPFPPTTDGGVSPADDATPVPVAEE